MTGNWLEQLIYVKMQRLDEASNNLLRAGQVYERRRSIAGR
jgi:hypothetical protein